MVERTAVPASRNWPCTRLVQWTNDRVWAWHRLLATWLLALRAESPFSPSFGLARRMVLACSDNGACAAQMLQKNASGTGVSQTGAKGLPILTSIVLRQKPRTTQAKPQTASQALDKHFGQRPAHQTGGKPQLFAQLRGTYWVTFCVCMGSWESRMPQLVWPAQLLASWFSKLVFDAGEMTPPRAVVQLRAVHFGSVVSQG